MENRPSSAEPTPRNYGEFLPCAARANEVCVAASARLIDSLFYLLELSAEHIDYDYRSLSSHLLEAQTSLSLNGNSKLSSDLFAVHDELFHSLAEDNEERVRDCLEILNGPFTFFRSQEVISINAVNSTPVGRLILNTLRRDFASSYAQPFNICEISDRNYIRSKEAVQRSIGVLADSSPELWNEIAVVLDRFLIVGSTSGGAGSCFKTFGLIFLNNLTPESHWTRYFGDIIHEAAHNYLYCLSMFVDIVEDNSGFYKTPLRPEPRPLYMAFHQMFVLARSYIAMHNLANHDDSVCYESKIDYTYSNKNILDEFDRAFAVCSENANKLSDVGRELLEDSWVAVAKRR